jgi:hypothetical protein
MGVSSFTGPVRSVAGFQVISDVSDATASTTIPNMVFATYSMLANGSLADQHFFVAPQALTVVAISEVHSTAGSDGGAVTIMVERLQGTEAQGGNGDDLLTAGFNAKGTANTVQTGTLTTTTANLNLSSGDRLGLDFVGTLTALAGVVVTVAMSPTVS